MTPQARLAFDPIDTLSQSDRDEVRDLSLAVYPPAVVADWPGRHREWARPGWCVRLWDGSGRLVSYTGTLLTEGTCDGRPVLIGGIGGVMTHPLARKRGHAATCIQRADAFFHDRGAHFALLVCKPSLLPYYGALGWREHTGTPKTLQRAREEVFTFNRVMIIGVTEPGPQGGVIDLEGPPW